MGVTVYQETQTLNKSHTTSYLARVKVVLYKKAMM